MTVEHSRPLHRGRFAPSPTGPLHMGSLLAAMGSYLQARHSGGQWLVRVEDLDPPREVPGATTAILAGLEAHGFEWDGKVVYQSERGESYLAALDVLARQQFLFACRCSRRDLFKAGKAGKEGPIYPGTCRQAGLADAPGRALRFAPAPGILCFRDALQGKICEDVRRETGDFVVRRRDGLIAYQLAVVVDDAEQGINAVVRGCDLLRSTARQIRLQQALGLAQPEYMHLPLIMGRDRKKLSKQNGAEPLDDSQALANLYRAHHLLRQKPLDTGAVTTVREFWSLAIANWDPSPLIGLREIAAPAAARL